MSNLIALQQKTPVQREFQIPAEGLHIGRTPDNAVQLTDDVVSRHHATVWAQGEQAFIRDEGATNGSFVGELRLTPGEPHPLQVGDEIRIGSAVFTVASVASPLPAAISSGVPPSTSANSMYLVGGGILLVVAVLVVLIASANRPVANLPSTLTPVPTVTAVTQPSSVPTVPPPTAAPVATPTTAVAAPQPQPSAVARMLALIESPDGASFSGGSAYILLRWKDSQPLAPDETYHVTLDCDRQPGIAPEGAFVKVPLQWQVPAHVYDALVDPRQCRWTVFVVDGARNVVASATATWTFRWEKGIEAQSNVSPAPTIER